MAADETRAALLNAAAKTFAARGYDGASISEISSEAGLTSGAVYAHFASKAELFVATLRAFGERDLDQLLGAGGQNLADGLISVGGSFDRREPTEESLLITAIVAARRHPEVGELVVGQMAEREGLFRDLVRSAQAAGAVSQDASAAAVSRLSLVIALGSLVVGAMGLEPVAHEDWVALISRLVESLRD